ncbi:LL-diaminopimelate aminotransferase apoenzyme [Paludibacter propionicigenes WB4]|uniref:LL-diaminopimelate aminotransferase n=1 Tax=Paludibacter propionicigenes (strain DSM 17365 / JCM 13257 / WB4) TaxID=694427 RepID=E4T3E9_PALPW|nr:LL-diaminopimelate aminotransferase [Paludibacter propionicigenes]ADQ79243.1 LL-diaminopimelate aminotransferase apoenzyme [Paludibacter propionicigenes WB4]
MAQINENFIKIPATYLFSEIAKRVAQHKEENPTAPIIRMGIGDVSLPLPDASVDAMIKAADEQRSAETFRGYGPEQGYAFLREAIVINDFTNRGIDIAEDEIFVSDGAKSDTGNIGDIFDVNNRVAITDPSYPVYVDTNAMAGRAGEPTATGEWTNLVYLQCNSENNFVPALPTEKVDLVYLCYPNNPTGTTLTKEQLTVWVEYAKANNVILLFDAAYEAFITEEDVPHSIYEIEGAKDVAIEFRSFSKTAGFTGTRCGYTVVPKQLMGNTANGEKVSLNKLWNRRQCTKFNGTSYIVQRAAEATYSPEGKKQVKALIDFYTENARIIREGLTKAGYTIFGGVNAPYVWAKAPVGMGSWEYFDFLLKEKNIVTTPGAGFGASGEGYVRFSAFGSRENTIEAMKRLEK